MLTLESVVFHCFHYYLCQNHLGVSPPSRKGNWKLFWNSTHHLKINYSLTELLVISDVNTDISVWTHGQVYCKEKELVWFYHKATNSTNWNCHSLQSNIFFFIESLLLQKEKKGKTMVVWIVVLSALEMLLGRNCLTRIQNVKSQHFSLFSNIRAAGGCT